MLLWELLLYTWIWCWTFCHYPYFRMEIKSKRPVDAESILQVYRTDLCGTDGVREEVSVSDATHIKQMKRKSTKCNLTRRSWLHIQGVHEILCFSFKCCDFSERSACFFCSAGVWPAIVYTHRHLGETERDQCLEYISKSLKSTIFNEHPVCLVLLLGE